MATKITPFKLTEADLARLADLRDWYGLPSAAAALRHAVGCLHAVGPPPKREPKPRKKRPG